MIGSTVCASCLGVTMAQALRVKSCPHISERVGDAAKKRAVIELNNREDSVQGCPGPRDELDTNLRSPTLSVHEAVVEVEATVLTVDLGPDLSPDADRCPELFQESKPAPSIDM